MKGYIYKIQNKNDGKCYIGKTRQYFEDRIKEHFYMAYYEGSNSYFHRMIRENKIEDFICSYLQIVEGDNLADLNKKLKELELKYIIEYDSCNNGYNTFYPSKDLPKRDRQGEFSYTRNDINKGARIGKYEKDKICMYDMNGNLVETFDGIVDASKSLNVSKGSISNCIHGRKDYLKGFIFRKGDEKPNMDYYKDKTPIVVKSRKHRHD